MIYLHFFKQIISLPSHTVQTNAKLPDMSEARELATHLEKAMAKGEERGGTPMT